MCKRVNIFITFIGRASVELDSTLRMKVLMNDLLQQHVNWPWFISYVWMSGNLVYCTFILKFLGLCYLSIFQFFFLYNVPLNKF